MKTVLFLAFLLAVLARSGSSFGEGLADLQGRVEVDGSSTVAPITIEVAHQFSHRCPEVTIPVAVSGTGGGFKRFTRGDTDISNASRSILESEMEACRLNHVKFVELPVAYDGLTVVVNRHTSWIDNLSLNELKRIFRDGSRVHTWNDVREGWPRIPIKLYIPGTDSGSFDYFKEVVGGDCALRDDMSVSEDDNQLVSAIARTKGALGFFGAAYFLTNTDKLQAVPIINPGTGAAVLPTKENIENGSYAPFSRPLFIYVNAASAKRPEVKLFVNFYLDHAAQLATSVGYVGLPDEVYEAGRTAFNHRPQPLTGTLFFGHGGQGHTHSFGELYTVGHQVE